ncbi:hypothetical protein HOLleu_00998 [Holothuria leucospilota]|uniref:Fibronectin type-III domain-containing protein n=1 Tax=Holothuria leucospilota TaxID=206669 RepID=A0A9Q1CMX4_HOLLE|nr:hypothetical protein HOLleu_00998 [Holothuria leucospilota]
MQGGSVSVTASLRFTFIDLDSGVNYSFSVATVREGNGGEGPKSPSLDVKIFCAGIRCRSGVIKFTVYYYYSSSPEKITEDVMDPTANSTILYNLTAGVSYTFFVTLSTSGGESEGSNEVDHLVPVQPSLADPPSLTHVTCNSVTMIWGKWTQSKDPGTPPIVHYIPYHRVNASFNWISGDIDIHNETIEEYQYTFHDLKADSIYEFCVVVVREGFGGEGDKNNIAKQSTAYCSDSPGKTDIFF